MSIMWELIHINQLIANIQISESDTQLELATWRVFPYIITLFGWINMKFEAVLPSSVVTE